MTAATILSQIGFSVAAFGWRFRLYAILSAVTIIVFGALASMQAAKLVGAENPVTASDRRLHRWLTSPSPLAGRPA